MGILEPGSDPSKGSQVPKLSETGQMAFGVRGHRQFGLIVTYEDRKVTSVEIYD